MFIKEVIKKYKSSDGSRLEYVQHRLVESYRIAAGPRQRIILNLGTLEISKEHWKDLANAIEDKLNKQKPLIPYDEEIDGLARHFTDLIIKNTLNKTASENGPVKSKEKDKPEYETVDVNSASTSNSRTIGAEHIICSQMKQLDLFPLLEKLGLTPQQQKYAAVLIAGRLINPSSERECARWARDDSAISEILNIDNVIISDNTLHRIADLLFERHKEIELALSSKNRDLFSLQESLILYDLTNTYFESPKRESSIAKYGRSKEKRSDCPLITLALVVDGQGFPKMSRIFRGNIGESKTLEGILNELPDYTFNDKEGKTIIIDAGIASEDNLKLIRDKNCHYVAVSRKSSYNKEIKKIWDETSWGETELIKGQKLQYKSARFDDEVFLLCKSASREAKEAAIWQRREDRFVDELQKLNEGLSKKRTTKKYEKILERIGRFYERYKMGKRFKVEVIAKKGLATEIKWEMLERTKKKPAGEYVLRTNRVNLTDEKISKAYRILGMVESSFKWMKSDLGLRPNFHRNDERCKSHIFISVLAYFILAPIMSKMEWGSSVLNRSTDVLDEKAVSEVNSLSWSTILKNLRTHVRVTSSFLTKDKYRIDIRTSTDPTTKQFEIYKKLKITPYPLKAVRYKRPVFKKITDPSLPQNI